ncbi:conserved hypothetical protein [Neospora caninum Liverpool]|uniref:Deacetylase sirtuin-type domain-containing protein n=1 Tax=Neospora caninum (strain Liverpool) TaxID=572307 RepID=F0VCP5_NEOCL|nr:conserved hypothetical protein [Neospora caninum Liverpool]CBZ51734.1 conserved hypothetical protein [Neospora caninum Liverpool]|eukprot:XP_003881767.1 conserved hypothetical protein [Neospora caninum Liverpool]
MRRDVKSDEGKQKILFVTGAGTDVFPFLRLSVGSGIPLYRKASSAFEGGALSQAKRRRRGDGRNESARGRSDEAEEKEEARRSSTDSSERRVEGETASPASSAGRRSLEPAVVWDGEDAGETGKARKKTKQGRGEKRLGSAMPQQRTRGMASEDWGLVSTFRREKERWFSSFWYRAHDPRLFRRAFPSPGHFVLAFLLLSRPSSVLLVTQNVDRMHHVALVILRDAMATQLCRKALEREKKLQKATGAETEQTAERENEGTQERKMEAHRGEERGEEGGSSLSASRVPKAVWRGLATRGGWWRIPDACGVDGQAGEKNVYELHGSIYSYRCSGLLPSSRVLLSSVAGGDQRKFASERERRGARETVKNEQDEADRTAVSTSLRSAGERDERLIWREAESGGSGDASCAFRFHLPLHETQVAWCPYPAEKGTTPEKKKAHRGEDAWRSEEKEKAENESLDEAAGDEGALQIANRRFPRTPCETLDPWSAPSPSDDFVSASPFPSASSLSVLPTFPSARLHPSSEALEKARSSSIMLPVCPSCSSLCLPLCLWFDESLFLSPHSAFESPAAFRHAFLFLGGVKSAKESDVNRSRDTASGGSPRPSSRAEEQTNDGAKEEKEETRDETAETERGRGGEKTQGGGKRGRAGESTMEDLSFSPSFETRNGEGGATEPPGSALGASLQFPPSAFSVDVQESAPSLVFVGTSFSTASTDWPVLLHSHAVKARRLFRSRTHSWGESEGEKDSRLRKAAGFENGSSTAPRHQTEGAESTRRQSGRNGASGETQTFGGPEAGGEVFCINSGSCLDASYEATERQKAFLDSQYAALFTAARARVPTPRSRVSRREVSGCEETEKLRPEDRGAAARGDGSAVKAENATAVKTQDHEGERRGTGERPGRGEKAGGAVLETVTKETSAELDCLHADGGGSSSTSCEDVASPEESLSLFASPNLHETEKTANRLGETGRHVGDPSRRTKTELPSSPSSASPAFAPSVSSRSSTFAGSSPESPGWSEGSVSLPAAPLSSLAHCLPSLPADFAAAGSPERGSVLEVRPLPRMRRIVGDASDVLLSACPSEVRAWLTQLHSAAQRNFFRMVTGLAHKETV